jgi:ribosome-associated toxin RatA of RatAB toxin-antitoxin module
MPTINRSALVPHTTEEMFQLVDDVDRYVEFLPWCTESRVLERSEDEVVATILLSKGSLNKAFTTRNLLQKHKMIEMRLVDGPFKHLQGFWRFDSLNDNACKVSLDLDYEFSSKLVALAIGPVFNQIANTLVDAFVVRAKELKNA